MADYNKVGLLVVRGDRILLCRKRGLAQLILPGGSIEACESDMACLTRELREELGAVSAVNLEYVDTYEDRAATNDPSIVKTVSIRLYRGDLRGEPVASSEIAGLVWFGPDSDPDELSPILANKILPDLRRRALLPWGSQ